MMVHNISEEEGVDMKTMEDTVEETDKIEEVDMKMTLEVIKSTQKINAVGKLTKMPLKIQATDSAITDSSCC